MTSKGYGKSPRDGEKCLICGKPEPPGHVVVTDNRERRKGVVCSSHTLVEVELNPQHDFMLTVTLWNGE